MVPFRKAHTLCATEQFEIVREGRFIVVELRTEHKVLSTSYCNGGQVRGVGYLVNHQSCEGTAHHHRHDLIRRLNQEGYHLQVCQEMGLDPGKVALMGTAANMNYAACVARRDEDLSVTAVVTAGTQGNAACAGNPAQWRETEFGWQQISPVEGTINMILLFNVPLTDAAVARAVVTMTEAKTAALYQLAVPSLYSEDLATGTGTDQYCIACPVDESRRALTSTSPHVKLGELIGRAVLEATKEALRWQNGLEPSYTRSLFHALGRFGLREERFWEEIGHLLSSQDLELLRKNSKSVFYEPLVAAGAYAYAAVLDRVRYGTLSESLSREMLRQQAATIACGLAAKPDRWPEYRGQLQLNSNGPVSLVIRAIAMGWSTKWS
ncbi:MAG: adenosylcobinamide amidohydrolase [Acidobacteriota bacterium]